MSSETKDIETYLFVKDRIAKYQLGIDISSKPLKNKLIEINTNLKFEDKEEGDKKSYFEIIYSNQRHLYFVLFQLSVLKPTYTGLLK